MSLIKALIQTLKVSLWLEEPSPTSYLMLIGLIGLELKVSQRGNAKKTKGSDVLQN